MRKKVEKTFWGFGHHSLLGAAVAHDVKAVARTAEVLIHLGGQASAPKAWKEFFVDTPSQAKSMIRTVDRGERVLILVSPLAGDEVERDPALKASRLTRIRDAMGPLMLTLERLDVQVAELTLDLPADEINAALTGLEIAMYRFKQVLKGEAPKFAVRLRGRRLAIKAVELEQKLALARGVNLARHLTNLPPNLLNPETYADFVKNFFAPFKGLKIEVWDEKRLAKENMNLHLAVGQGSKTQPRLVRLTYHGGGKSPAVALVGKGITFDSGGLDIKPSSGMRLMKKDMGGSAAVIGVLYWAALSRAKITIDAYLSLAENAVSGESFRPSDVIKARNGMSVEIHNTDAEGRLVLADAMALAVEPKAKPKALIDVATLTGAIKVALGSNLAGLFSNDPKLRKALHESGQDSGDPNWPMPLVQKYKAQLNSNFADMVNATDGFGGAITAALFLEKFAGEVPWAHLDIYAWKDSPDGAWCEAGGSGQGVASLVTWLDS